MKHRALASEQTKMSRAARSAAALFAVLLCMVLWMPSAHADEINVNITATPTELEDTDTVTFTFEIANYNADYPLLDLTITYNGTIYDVTQGQEVPPSGTLKNIVLPLTINASQLGKPLTFTLNWTRNGEPMTQDVNYTVQRAENPVIEITRTADKQNAKPGETITLTYVVKNATKFDMTDITLIDENISDNAILQLNTLRASGTYSINYSYIMGDESVISMPFATYTVNGKTKTFTSADSLPLIMVLIQLDMKVTMGTPTINGVNFSFNIKNTGSQTISGIQITDERLNLVNEEVFTLEPGEDYTLSFLVVPLMTEQLRNVSFKLAGVDPFGEDYTLQTETPYEVYPFIDETQISVTITAETVTQWTAESRVVTARITIVNHSTVELKNVTILETTQGVIKTYDGVFPTGVTTFDQEIPLGSPKNLSFTVKGVDPTGFNRVLGSYLMPVAYGTSTEEVADNTPAPDNANMGLFNSLSSAITKILIVLGVLMVLSFVVLVVLTAMERSRMPMRMNGNDDDEEDDFEDYYAPREERRQRAHAYTDSPDPEELSYTKRMLSARDEGQAGVVNNGTEPARLPPPPPPQREPQPVAAEEPRIVSKPAPVIYAEPPKPQPEEAAERLITTARTRYTEEQSKAAYRPAGFPTNPAARTAPPVQPKKKENAPRIFEYKKQPVRQPTQKRVITRVEKQLNAYAGDDEE